MNLKIFISRRKLVSRIPHGGGGRRTFMTVRLVLLSAGLALAVPGAPLEARMVEMAGEAMPPSAQDQGLGFREAPQTVIGWTSKAVYRNGEIRIKLRDAHQRPIERAQVSVSFAFSGRPELAFTVKLGERGKGRYFAPVTLSETGHWTVYITATKLDREYDSVATVDVDR